MRLCPASSAACDRLLQERTTPGRIAGQRFGSGDAIENAIASVPKRSARRRADDPLKLLCPDVYDGKGGIGMSVVQPGSATVSGLPSESASTVIAVYGRR